MEGGLAALVAVGALAAVGGEGGSWETTHRAAASKNPALLSRLADLPIEATLRRRPIGAEGRRVVKVARQRASPPAVAGQ